MLVFMVPIRDHDLFLQRSSNLAGLNIKISTNIIPYPRTENY